jgi:Ca2+/Na+ antiporter
VIIASKLYGKNWVIDKFSFWRDFSFYVCALVAILIVAADGAIERTESLVFIGMHVLYIIFVVVSGRHRYKASIPASDDLEAESNTKHLHKSDQNENQGSSIQGSGVIVGCERSQLLQVSQALTLTAQRLASTSDDEQGAGETGSDELRKDKMVGLDWDPDASKLEKAIYWVELPFYILRWLTIPGADRQWSRCRRICTCVSFPFVLVMMLFDSPHAETNSWNYISFIRTGTPTYPGSDGSGHHATSTFATRSAHHHELMLYNW